MALFNHDPNQILGRASAGTLALRVDKKGLRYSIDAETRLGGDLLHSIERGDIQGSSFGFIIKDQKLDRSAEGRMIRTIRSVELLDVGPVSEAAYSGTTAEARNLDKLDSIIAGHQASQQELENRHDD